MTVFCFLKKFYNEKDIILHKKGTARVRQKIHYLDYHILIPYLLLVVFGIIMVYSSSSDILLVNGFKPATYGIRQAIYALVAFFGFGVPIFALKIDVFKSKKFVVLCFIGIFGYNEDF